jgi:long-chain acyl-CoA synthetase
MTVETDIEAAVAGRTLLDAFDDTVAKHGDVVAYTWRADGEWQSLTWRDLRTEVEAATLGLLEFGVARGAMVGVLMSNRPELAVADLALLHVGAVPVCLFDSFTDDQLATVVTSLGIDTVIVDGTAELDRLPAVAHRITAEDWPGIVAAGRERAARDDGGFDASRRAVRPDDLVSVNYTSGTTGALKGVRHTHHNVLWHAESFSRFLPMSPGARYLSYLSRAHATERFVTTWFPLVTAGTVHLCPDPARLPHYLREVRPEFFGGVLRVWESLYAAVVGLPDQQSVPALLGLDACRFAFSGGGALAVRVQDYFNGLGVPLAEGWGQSELVSAATCGRPGEIRTGTVGPPLPGVAVRAAQDGELLVRSGSRMAGYAGVVTEQASTVDTEGWVHTGDLGWVDEDGFVHVHGRRQEVFRLSDGYVVATTRVESQLRANVVVDNACVVGGDELCALLVVADASADEVLAAVREANGHLGERDRIARFTVLPGQWELGRAEELTHSGKIKRSLVATKYADVIAALLAGGGTAVD